MGPRLFRRGNADERIAELTAIELQWGHAFSGVETALYQGALHPEISGLQWGHAFSGVETSRTRSTRTPTRALQWGHAFSGVETERERVRFVAAQDGFNGATPFQAWKRHSTMSRPGPARRCFNGATPFQAWKHNLEKYSEPIWRRFNGATPFQAWKHVDELVDPAVRGRFNGATPFQAWKQEHQDDTPDERESFNGATPFQAWKQSAIANACSLTLVASMGPRLFRRGNEIPG